MAAKLVLVHTAGGGYDDGGEFTRRAPGLRPLPPVRPRVPAPAPKPEHVGFLHWVARLIFTGRTDSSR